MMSSLPPTKTFGSDSDSKITWLESEWDGSHRGLRSSEEKKKASFSVPTSWLKSQFIGPRYPCIEYITNVKSPWQFKESRQVCRAGDGLQSRPSILLLRTKVPRIPYTYSTSSFFSKAPSQPIHAIFHPCQSGVFKSLYSVEKVPIPILFSGLVGFPLAPLMLCVARVMDMSWSLTPLVAATTT